MPAPATATLRAANRRGILAMAAGMACFVANDALIKAASPALPLSELIFLRGLVATALLLAAAVAAGVLRHPAGLREPHVLLRAGLDAVATLAYLGALFRLPLSVATAITMAAPLLLVLLAAVVLGERVPAGRWLAIATGFAGVLLVVQPRGAALDAYALLCLGAAVLHAGRDLATRLVDARIPSLLVTLASAAAVTLLSGLCGLGQAWQWPAAPQLALLAGAGVFLGAGYFLLIAGLRDGELGVIAPFRYTGLLFALGLGYAVWGEVPNPLAWAGIALLAASGVAVLRGQGRPPRP